jgi:O-antigen/teichoic acid export membrane protein
MMRGRDDIIVGIGATGITMAVGLAVVPVYIRILGVEAYGLVGFLALLQGSLQLLDMGLSPTVSREVARAGTTGHYAAAIPLFRTLARLYLGVGLVIGIALAVAAPLVASRWLHPDALDIGVVTTSIAIMGLILACRWPVGIYSGALIGAHQVRTVSLITLAFAIVSQIGGAIVIAIVPRIEILFVWQAIAAFIQLLVFRTMTWRRLGSQARGSFELGTLSTIWRFSVGMSILTVLAVTLSQLDRAIVSKLVSLQAFGLYALASVMGRALYGLINPVYNVVYPRFTAMLERGEDDRLAERYGEWTSLFCSFFFPASMAIIIAAEPIVRLWTGDAVIAREVAPLIGLIAAGSALHGAMYFPFAAQVASGDARTPVIINLMLVALYVPLLLVFVSMKGIFGAALAWCVLFALYVPLGTWITHRRILRSIALRWLFGDVGIAFAISLAIAAVTIPLLWLTPMHDVTRILVAGASAAVATGVCFAATALRYVAAREQAASLLRRLSFS